MKKIFFVNGTREAMMEFTWEYLIGRMDCEIMHRSDLYDSYGLFVKVDDGNSRRWFIQACAAYGINILWKQSENEEAA